MTSVNAVPASDVTSLFNACALTTSRKAQTKIVNKKIRGRRVGESVIFWSLFGLKITRFENDSWKPARTCPSETAQKTGGIHKEEGGGSERWQQRVIAGESETTGC